MLSHPEFNSEESSYPEESFRNYKPTDIFNLAPASATPGKRQHVDRNRSSLFRNEGSAAPTLTAKPDRMASDIFFGGNSPASTRFGGYEPSTGLSRRSSAKDVFKSETGYDTLPEPR
ncbi:hypothetical protein HDU91_001765, partial [Kappamyces sp. JEL0680]